MIDDTTQVDSGWDTTEDVNYHTYECNDSCDIEVTVEPPSDASTRLITSVDPVTKLRKYYGSDNNEFDDITAKFTFNRADYVERALEASRYSKDAESPAAWIELAAKASI